MLVIWSNNLILIDTVPLFEKGESIFPMFFMIGFGSYFRLAFLGVTMMVVKIVYSLLLVWGNYFYCVSYNILINTTF